MQIPSVNSIYLGCPVLPLCILGARARGADAKPAELLTVSSVKVALSLIQSSHVYQHP